MKVLSLFDGMSCGQIALERAGFKVDKYFASEIDKWAINITQKNYPDTIQLGSVFDVPFGPFVEKIDLLLGGSPCQGFSSSGKRKAFSDPRSRLFFRFVEAIERIKPTYFLFENVQMSRDSELIITNLLGSKPIKINSSLVSAQERTRLYWTNIPHVSSPLDKNIMWSNVMENDAENCFYYTENSFAWLFKSQKRRSRYKEYTSTSACKMQMIEASHYKGYSNQRCFGIKDTDGVRYISPLECERLQTVPEGYTEGVSNTQRYKMLGNGWTVDVIVHLLQGLPDSYKDNV